MALRIKSRWRDDKPNALTAARLVENAGALAFIVWRLSLEGARGLHGEGYEYLSDRERIGVITEYVAFLVQCADRLMYARLAPAAAPATPGSNGGPVLDVEAQAAGDSYTARATFINALAQRLANQVHDNLTDIAGPGNYRGPFLAALNARLRDYAELTFEREPGYDALRYFGAQVLAAMAETQTNRWVMDQVMSIEAPAVFARLRDALTNLFESGHHEAAGEAPVTPPP